jgi:hypothetical protein
VPQWLFINICLKREMDFNISTSIKFLQMYFYHQRSLKVFTFNRLFFVVSRCGDPKSDSIDAIFYSTSMRNQEYCWSSEPKESLRTCSACDDWLIESSSTGGLSEHAESNDSFDSPSDMEDPSSESDSPCESHDISVNLQYIKTKL